MNQDNLSRLVNYLGDNEPFDPISIDHYVVPESGLRENMFDICKETLMQIWNNVSPVASLEGYPADVKDFLFIMKNTEKRSKKFDRCIRTCIVGGAFICANRADIILLPEYESMIDEMKGKIREIVKNRSRFNSRNH